MTQDEFSRWHIQFRKTLDILRSKDHALAQDLQQNTIIDIIKKTAKYIGDNKNIAHGYLPMFKKRKKRNVYSA